MSNMQSILEAENTEAAFAPAEVVALRKLATLLPKVEKALADLEKIGAGCPAASYILGKP